MKKILAIALCCLALTACAPGAPEPTSPTIIPVTTGSPTLPSTEAPTAAPTEEILLTFTLYSGNDNADGFICTEISVPEITETVILEKLIEYGVFPDNVTINSFTSEGSRLNIDFNEAFLNYLCTMGTSGEMILVGSVVQTFLNAYQAESVLLTVEGSVFESGHVIYDFPMSASDFVY